MFHFQMGQVSSAMVKLFIAAAAGELVGQQLSVFWMHIFDVLIKRLSVFETFVTMIALKKSCWRFPAKKNQKKNVFFLIMTSNKSVKKIKYSCG